MTSTIRTAMTWGHDGYRTGQPRPPHLHIDFVGHLDLDQTPQPRTRLQSWPDLAVRMEQAPFLTIASIRGRTR